MSRLLTTKAISGARSIALLSLVLPALIVPGCSADSGDPADDYGAESVFADQQGLSTGYVPEATVPMGTIRGSFKVDEKGGATYSMPLTVPPGASGVEPKLSLLYSTHLPNSMLGMRVALGGL